MAEYRAEEKNELRNILRIKDPDAFQERFSEYAQGKDSLESYHATHKKILELKELLNTKVWSEEQTSKVHEIISPWVEDNESFPDKPFNQYFAENRDAVQNKFKAAFNGQNPRTYIEEAMDLPAAKEAMKIGAVSHQLSVINNKLLQLDELHKSLLTLKDATETEAANEIDGIPLIHDKLDKINQKSTTEDVLSVVNDLKQLELDDGEKLLVKTKRVVDTVLDTTSKFNDQKTVIENELYDKEDINPNYLYNSQRTIDKFRIDCKKCSQTEAWKKVVNQQPADLIDDNGYPRIDTLKEIEKKTNNLLLETKQKRDDYALWVEGPEKLRRIMKKPAQNPDAGERKENTTG